MKIYLAGNLRSFWAIEQVACWLRQHGHQVTSRWHTRPPDRAAPALRSATEDWEDMDAADALVHFTDLAKHFGGARHFEAGYAFGRGKRLIIFGPRENLFYHLPGVGQATSWAHLLELLR